MRSVRIDGMLLLERLADFEGPVAARSVDHRQKFGGEIEAPEGG